MSLSKAFSITQWTSIKESPPPSYTYLLLRGKMTGTDAVFVVLGYWSERANTFMSVEDGFALLETLDLEDYHIVTDKEGMFIPIQMELPT